jgi:hypothetical protein
VKSSSSSAQAATKSATKLSLSEEKTQGEEVVLGQEVIDRLKSWCYV